MALRKKVYRNNQMKIMCSILSIKWQLPIWNKFRSNIADCLNICSLLRNQNITKTKHVMNMSTLKHLRHSTGGNYSIEQYFLDNFGQPRPTFLDYQSTTPVDPRVLDAMLPYLCGLFGNAHSRSHAYGWEAEASVESARAAVARLINAKPRNIVFTSGATEANNLCLKGVCGFYGRPECGQKNFNETKLEPSKIKEKFTPQYRNHIITTQIEHKCVLASCRELERIGFEVSYLPVDREGLVTPSNVADSIIPGKTILCSVMHVNNEIGVVQNLQEIGNICRSNGVFFHTDAAQGFGKIPIDVEAMHIDLLSISAHKIYGPKGVGALYIRHKPKVRLFPILHGGAQERGLRSGTLPVPLIVGFGAACNVCMSEMENDRRHIEKLALKLKREIEKIPEVKLNGSHIKRYYGNMNFSFAFVEGESLLMSLKNVACSSGSACTSASLEPSYVLRAIGVSEDLAHTSLRFGIGRFTTEEEIEQCVEDIKKHVTRLREMSPLYEISVTEGCVDNSISKSSDSNFIWT